MNTVDVRSGLVGSAVKYDYAVIDENGGMKACGFGYDNAESAANIGVGKCDGRTVVMVDGELDTIVER